MMLIGVEQIAEVVGGERVRGSSDSTISGVSIDSRTTASGDVFFAVRGERFDGHDFVQSAVDKGASCVVVDRDIELSLDNQCTVIIIEDTIAALVKLAGWYRQQLAAGRQPFRVGNDHRADG